MNGYDMNGGMNGTLGDSNAHSGGEEEREDDDGAWKPSTYEPVTDYACEQVVERLSQHGATAWLCLFFANKTRTSTEQTAAACHS